MADMDSTDLVPLIEQLDDNIDDLEDALGPLLKGALSDTTGKIPLLDKARLHVLVTYAIESILFSYLRLNGVNAKEHPIFRELIRVKQYFDKIKIAESAGDAPKSKLDKAAAGRFIKHALAANEKNDQNVKTAAAHTRFDEISQSSEGNRDKALVPRDASNNQKRTNVQVPPDSSFRLGLADQDLSLDGAESTLKAKSGKEGKKRKSSTQSNGAEAVSDTQVLEDEQRHERKKIKDKHKKLKQGS